MKTSFLILFFFLISFISLLLILLILNKKDQKKSKTNSKDVKKFYNQTTDKFLAVYGEIIQAFRTKNVGAYLDYTMDNMRIQNDMKLLDAGCGVGGPAIHFAKHYPNIQIDACSISEVQIEKANKNIASNSLQDQIKAFCNDYHNLNDNFKHNHYDRVYFLESFGHSHDKKELLNAAWDVLKPGGMVYIKDLFTREVEEEWEQLYIDKICEDINQAYKYHIGDLYETLSILRKKGYIIHFMKIPEVDEKEFENLSISNDFQNLFDIGKIDSWDNYVFPIDFFEILAEKPRFSSEMERHLYFMNKS
jgi:cyclopropane fatty-acyl-phospholipid synthase-like methyltransferase